jgi:hypothetical protein
VKFRASGVVVLVNLMFQQIIKFISVPKKVVFRIVFYAKGNAQKGIPIQERQEMFTFVIILTLVIKNVLQLEFVLQVMRKKKEYGKRQYPILNIHILSK